MYRGHKICALLPARNEAPAVAQVIDDLVQLGIFDQIVVCDNASTDQTAALAASSGAKVVFQSTPGYGIACQTALQAVTDADIVVFVDADNSLVISESLNLLDAIVDGSDLAIGVRVKQWREKGSMTWPQLFGNWIAGHLIRIIWSYPVSDLGPFRAIRFKALRRLDMQDQRFGWTVEMQIKAIQARLNMIEIPVHYRRRIGQSKISGTIGGVFKAGFGIIGTIVKLAFHNPFNPPCKTTMPRKP